MGMYTEIVIKACLKDDLPQEVVNIFDFLFNGKDEEKIPLESLDDIYKYKDEIIAACKMY